MEATHVTEPKPLDLLIDGLNCRRLATRLAPRLLNHIRRSATEWGRAAEIESLTTADSTGVLHHLYKCNSSLATIRKTVATPTYDHEPGPYMLHICSAVQPDLSCLDVQTALDPILFRERLPSLLQALDWLMNSSCSYLMTHAIDVLCVVESPFPHSADEVPRFPGTLICQRRECPFQQLQELLQRVVSHWLSLLSLSENRDGNALYAETLSAVVIPQTRWPSPILVLCENALSVSFMLRCLHDISNDSNLSRSESVLFRETHENLTLAMNALASAVYAQETSIDGGVARDFVFTNVLGERRQSFSLEALCH